MRGVIVRALWGGEQIVTSAKAAQCAADAQQYADHLSPFEQRVVAYGDACGDLLRQLGHRPIVVPDALPACYRVQRPVPRRLPMSDPHGRWTDGLSMWWRKLHAILVAWEAEPRPQAVIWLDWDTGVSRRLHRRLFDHLRDGPPIKGRLRQYFRPQVSWRRTAKRQVYHGGCFYLGDRAALERIIQTHATKYPICTDEVAITRVVDEMIGIPNDTLSHRALGYDCGWLYSTRRNVIDSADDACFTEGQYTSLKAHVALSAVHRP